MKKILLFSFFTVFVFQLSQAQSFQIINPDTLVIQPDEFAISEAHAALKNNTNQQIRTIVKREIISLAPDHINYFCWGINCYAPTTTQSPDTLLLHAQSTNPTFKGYIDPDGGNGISIVRYCFINANNPADQVCFKVRYLFGTAAIGEMPNKQPQTQVPASYDPYTQTIRVNVSSGKIGIWNMIGQKVDLTWKYDGTGMVADASSLKPGYYFLFGEGDNRLWSARVIVSK